MNFRKEIEEHYTEKCGQVSIQKDPPEDSSGNGIMHTGHFFIILAENNLLNAKDFVTWDKYTESVTVKKDGANVWGLLFRSIYKKNDEQSHDDYYGFMAANYFLAPDLAEETVRYGEKTGFCYDNLKPWKGLPEARFGSLHDRFPGQIAFYKMCAKMTTSIYEQIPLALRILSTAIASKDASDSRIHAWLMLCVAKRESPLLFGLVNLIWSAIVRSRFGSIGKSWYTYYWDHPFVEIVN